MTRAAARYIALRWPVPKWRRRQRPTVLRLIAHNYLGIDHILYLTNVIRVFSSVLRSISARLNAAQIAKSVLNILHAHTHTTHSLAHEHVTRHFKRSPYLHLSKRQTLIFLTNNFSYVKVWLIFFYSTFVTSSHTHTHTLFYSGEQFNEHWTLNERKT